MAKQLPIVDVTVDTFSGWISKCNALVNLANTEIVTANNSANGAVTTGKGFVVGTFGANTIVCTTITGGNTVTTGPIGVTSNTTFTGQIVKVNSGVTKGANSISHSHAIRYNATTTSLQAVDTFAVSSYRSAKYVVSVTDSANTKFQVTEILLLQDGANTYTTEYATLLSNTALATFSSDISAGNVRLLATPAVANVFINIERVLVSI
jgi:hypothetical protein